MRTILTVIGVVAVLLIGFTAYRVIDASLPTKPSVASAASVSEPANQPAQPPGQAQAGPQAQPTVPVAQPVVVTPVAPTAACMPNAQVAQFRTDATGFPSFLTRMNAVYDSSGGNVGRDLTTPDGVWEIRSADRGVSGAVVYLTDTAHQAFRSLDGKPLNTSVYKLIGQGSWAAYLVLGDVASPSPGRMVRLCDPIANPSQAFPGATTAANGIY